MPKKAKKKNINTKILGIAVSNEIYNMIEEFKKDTDLPKRYIIERAVRSYIESEREEND